MVMRGWTHIAPAALFAATLSAGPLRADAPDDPLRFFATCAGQLGEEVRHLWTLSDPLADPSADQVEAVLDATLAILEALTTPDRAVAARAWRIEARAAHGQLLSRAHYRGDAWAETRARRILAQCAAYVLGPPGTEAADPPRSGTVLRTAAAD